jgi:DNA-binding LytR/AlgR family response regulator
MRVIIIEDEAPAASRLARMLQDIDGGIEVMATLDSVEASVKYLQENEPELLFMDIQLADGLSFSIFQQVKLVRPVIFTTAFDHYVLKAFKVNSVDYLLKPIDQGELRQAVEKYRQLYSGGNFRGGGGSGELGEKIERLMREMSPARYKERLLIKRGQQLHFLKTSAMAHCHADGKLCYATDFNGNNYLLDNNLIQLEEAIDPRQFYRVNRQLLVNIEAIRKVHTWLGGRLKLEVSPPTPADTVVSRERVNGFRDWLGQ